MGRYLCAAFGKYHLAPLWCFPAGGVVECLEGSRREGWGRGQGSRVVLISLVDASVAYV